MWFEVFVVFYSFIVVKDCVLYDVYSRFVRVDFKEWFLSDNIFEVFCGIYVDVVIWWILEYVEGFEVFFIFVLIIGGYFNFIYSVDDVVGCCIVLRCLFFGVVLVMVYDMGCEYCIILVFVLNDMLVLCMFVLCDDELVNDVFFYFMDYVDGVVFVMVQIVVDSVL